MKLALFNDFIPGVLVGEEIVDISHLVGDIMALPADERMLAVIAEFDRLQADLREAIDGECVPLSAVRLRAPLPRPSKILCCIGNYKEGVDAPLRPLDMFLKSPDSVIGPGDTVELPAAEATIFHHEAELAIVIGRPAKNVAPADARSHLFGFTCFIDVSARGIGQRSFIGKSFHTFGPVGPWIVTADEIADPQQLRVQLWDDSQLRQDYSTNDMEHPIEEIISWASHITVLNPGDIIACGTNHQGLGLMQDGERVEIEIAGIGRMGVQVADASKRSWPKGIDEGMARTIREGRLAPSR